MWFGADWGRWETLGLALGLGSHRCSWVWLHLASGPYSCQQLAEPISHEVRKGPLGLQHVKNYFWMAHFSHIKQAWLIGLVDTSPGHPLSVEYGEWLVKSTVIQGTSGSFELISCEALLSWESVMA